MKKDDTSRKPASPSWDQTGRRAIDLREGEKLNERAFKTLIRNAVALNAAE